MMNGFGDALEEQKLEDRYWVVYVSVWVWHVAH